MNEWLMELAQQGLSLLLQVVLLGVLAGLIWLRKELKAYLISNTSMRERELLTQLGKEAYILAETVYGKHDGPTKLNEATKYMLEMLRQRGMDSVSMEVIRAVIEQAWLEDRRRSGKPVEKSQQFEMR